MAVPSYEYLFTKVDRTLTNDDIVAILNEYGKAGWQLITFNDRTNIAGELISIVFIREIKVVEEVNASN